MATPDNRRKTPGNINLDKGERSIDLEKEGAQPMDPNAEEEAAAQQNGNSASSSTTTSRRTPNLDKKSSGGDNGSTEPPSAPEPKKKNGGRAWLWVIFAIIAVIIIVLIMPKSCTEAKEENEPVTLTEPVKAIEVDSTVAQTDSVVSAPEVASPQQNEVNENKTTNKDDASTAAVKNTAKVSDNIEQEALNVIRGEYGNNPQRRSALGQDYDAVQRRVNQMMRSGKY